MRYGAKQAAAGWLALALVMIVVVPGGCSSTETSTPLGGDKDAETTLDRDWFEDDQTDAAGESEETATVESDADGDAEAGIETEDPTEVIEYDASSEESEGQELSELDSMGEIEESANETPADEADAHEADHDAGHDADHVEHDPVSDWPSEEELEFELPATCQSCDDFPGAYCLNPKSAACITGGVVTVAELDHDACTFTIEVAVDGAGSQRLEVTDCTSFTQSNGLCSLDYNTYAADPFTLVCSVGPAACGGTFAMQHCPSADGDGSELAEYDTTPCGCDAFPGLYCRTNDSNACAEVEWLRVSDNGDCTFNVQYHKGDFGIPQIVVMDGCKQQEAAFDDCTLSYNPSSRTVFSLVCANHSSTDGGKTCSSSFDTWACPTPDGDIDADPETGSESDPDTLSCPCHDTLPGRYCWDESLSTINQWLVGYRSIDVAVKSADDCAFELTAQPDRSSLEPVRLALSGCQPQSVPVNGLCELVFEPANAIYPLHRFRIDCAFLGYAYYTREACYACDTDQECIDNEWIVDCLGHWDCKKHWCTPSCGDPCGDKVCSPDKGESLESCSPDCGPVCDCPDFLGDYCPMMSIWPCNYLSDISVAKGVGDCRYEVTASYVGDRMPQTFSLYSCDDATLTLDKEYELKWRAAAPWFTLQRINGLECFDTFTVKQCAAGGPTSNWRW